MKRMLGRLVGAAGFVAAMAWSSVATITVTGGAAALMAWSPPASAQSVDCSSGYYCTYGPFCVDAWGGCFYYSWWIGSAINTWEERRGGISDVIKLCTDPSRPDPSKCVSLTSRVEVQPLQPAGGPTIAIQCRAPGSQTCTDGNCGGSPGSSGTPFQLIGLPFTGEVTTLVPSSGCTKEERGGAGGVKCAKTNRIPIIENDPAYSAQYCQNRNWVIGLAIPLQFKGRTTATGPLTKQNPTAYSTSADARCWLKDPAGRFPYQTGYAPSTNLTQNFMYCEPDPVLVTAPAPQ